MIQVLLSTYNGERYLNEQLDSVFNQTYKDIKILVRDDGSTDKTIEILKKYKNKYGEKIEIIEGKNIGVVKSFFELINLSDETCEYFAFCDQDDVWLEEKLKRAVSKIKIKTPFLYFSNKILVDKNLNVLKIEKNKYDINFGNSLIENLATGCTVVINKKLIKAVKNKKIETKNIQMHDWFLFIIANLIGDVYHDEEAYMYYRQHENNVVGMESNHIKRNIKKIIRFIKKRKKNDLKNQILEVFRIFDNEIENYNELHQLIISSNIFDKIKLLKKIKRQNEIDNFIFKILMMFGWF